MILKRLYELAEREELLEDLAFEELPVPFVVNVGLNGEYLGIEERRGQITFPTRKKNALPKIKPDKGKTVNVPRAHGNTANVGFARFFVDTLARVLPVSDESKSVNSRRTFWKQIEEAATQTGDAALEAVLKLGRRVQSDEQLAATVRAELEAKKPAPGDRCTFAWHPDKGGTIIDRDAVRNWYREFFVRTTGAMQEAGPQGICQVTGEFGPLPTSHPGRLGGVPGGIASGVSLVSYDKAAFESYGLDGTVNAAIGCRAADGYLRALGALIQGKLPGHPRSSLKVGKVLFLFWTRQPTQSDDLMLLDRPDPEEVARLIESVRRGRLSDSADLNEFYCLTLSGNSARAIVRDYLEAPLSDVRVNLGRWFTDLRVVDESFNYQGQLNACFPLSILAAATAREMDDVAPPLPAQLMNAALKGLPLPDSVLAACLRRIRVESGSTQFRPARIALIKLCLNRTHCKGEQSMPESLTSGRTYDRSYVCGQLLAFLARCQSPQDFGTSAQILQRYFGSASTSPQSVFPTLLRLNRHHINKIRDENRGFAFNLEAELDELLLPLKSSGANSPDFPAILSLADQGRFALGFYHQRAEYRSQSADKKARAAEDKAAATNEAD